MKAKCIYKNRIGASGERIARSYLEGKNYRFIKSNYRYERAELDLIFEDVNSRTLIVAEVKTRRSRKFGLPEESLTVSKRSNIRRGISGFVSENEQYSGHDIRIDVIAIEIRDGRAEIAHIENAF